MNKKIITLAFTAALALGLSSCFDSDGSSPSSVATGSSSSSSDDDGSSSSVGTTAEMLPVITGAPTVAALTANNAVAATPAEISADLDGLSETQELAGAVSTMSGISSMAPMGLGGGGAMGKFSATTLAVETEDEDKCLAMDEDTSYTEDGISYVKKVEWLDADGGAFELCQSDIQDTSNATNEMYSLMDGSVIRMHTARTTDSTKYILNMLMTMDFAAQGDSMAFNRMDFAANMYIERAKPEPFNVYAELAGYMDPDKEGSNSSYTTVYWFADGRYKCDMSAYLSSGETEGTMCELVNAGQVVGSLYRASNIKVYVKDAEGNYVGDQPEDVGTL